MVLRSHLIAEEWDFNISQDVVDTYYICLGTFSAHHPLCHTEAQ